MVKSRYNDNDKLTGMWAESHAWLKDHSAKQYDERFLSLVLTDELLTGKLEALVGSPIEVILESAVEITIDDDRARHLGVESGSKGLSRTVWLTSRGKKLIYANTVISVEETDAKLFRSLKVSNEALGSIALNTDLKVHKDKLEIGTVSIKEINKGFGLNFDEKLLGRRSRMFIDNAMLNASIIEVFHSDIIRL